MRDMGIPTYSDQYRQLLNRYQRQVTRLATANGANPAIPDTGARTPRRHTGGR